MSAFALVPFDPANPSRSHAGKWSDYDTLAGAKLEAAAIRKSYKLKKWLDGRMPSIEIQDVHHKHVATVGKGAYQSNPLASLPRNRKIKVNWIEVKKDGRVVASVVNPNPSWRKTVYKSNRKSASKRGKR